MRAVRVLHAGLAGLGAVLLSALPAAAQTEGLAEIEAMVDGSTTADDALAAAQGQAQGGDVSQAATTLERALIGDPDNIPVRAAYIGYLCQLDDRQAALFEVGKLSGREVPKANWTQIEAACGRMARPKQSRKG